MRQCVKISYTEPIRPLQLQQTKQYPTKEDIDYFNPIVMVRSVSGLSTFNFVMYKGQRTEYKCGKEINQEFDIRNKQIAVVRLGFRESDSLLTSVHLFDVDGFAVCEAGWAIQSTTKIIEKRLEEGERLLGFKGNKHTEYNMSNHTDF